MLLSYYCAALSFAELGVSNVVGRASPRDSTCHVKYLGQMTTQADCAAACAAFQGIARCKSWSWYQPTHDDAEWREGCYGVTDHTWETQTQMHVSSGQLRSVDDDRCYDAEDCSYN
eukprot:6150937-Prymnesium_polylepis.1